MHTHDAGGMMAQEELQRIGFGQVVRVKRGWVFKKCPGGLEDSSGRGKKEMKVGRQHRINKKNIAFPTYSKDGIVADEPSLRH